MFDKLGWAMRHADDDEELRAILRWELQETPSNGRLLMKCY